MNHFVGEVQSELEVEEATFAITDNGLAKIAEGELQQFVSFDQINRLQFGSYDRPSMHAVRSAVVLSVFGYIVGLLAYVSPTGLPGSLQWLASVALIGGSTVVLLIGVLEYWKIRKGDVETVAQLTIHMDDSVEWFHIEREEDLDVSVFEEFMSELSEASSVELE